MANKKDHFADVDRLLKKIAEETPKPGQYLFDTKLPSIMQEKQTIGDEEFRKKYKLNFRDLPISQKTITGLKKRNFHKMTEIQRCVIPHALAGRDILGGSRTGSGKTLSYIVPIIERLY